MAIGIAKVLDFDLGKNFDLPYLAKNPSDFGADGILVCPAGLGIMFIFLLAEAEQVRERHTVICL